jgi:hypothetical protein
MHIAAAAAAAALLALLLLMRVQDVDTPPYDSGTDAAAVIYCQSLQAAHPASDAGVLIMMMFTAEICSTLLAACTGQAAAGQLQQPTESAGPRPGLHSVAILVRASLQPPAHAGACVCFCMEHSRGRGFISKSPKCSGNGCPHGL